MKCKKCGKEFLGLFSDRCPYCGFDNSASFGEAQSSLPKKNEKKKKKYDPYDWDDPNNCSDREYMDNDDYDDFDN